MTEQTDVPFVVGSDTSQQAAKDKLPTAMSDEARVLAFIDKCGGHGATDDEIEVALQMLHQNASARRYALASKGLVVDSGVRRRTRSNRRAVVWVVNVDPASAKPVPRPPSLRKQLREAREHADALDRNWANLHECSMGAIRDALGMPDASVPEMVQRINQLADTCGRSR
jgi:hypothetical protein